ncbi:MAG: MarR family transcriptional regulator [Treponema sp.]|nr:MarR family transcriptional regulator [Treponema sp.]
MEINSSISLVSYIHSQSADFLISKLKERGLPDFASSHGNILFQLSKKGQMTMGELARNINRDKSTTTVLVRKLEQEGLIQSQADKDDKRSRILSLTEKGSEYTAATNGISSELISTFYKGFSEEEKKDFVSYLERIKKNFE